MIGEIEEINTLHFVMQSKNGDVTIYGTLLLSGGGDLIGSRNQPIKMSQRNRIRTFEHQHVSK